MFKISTNWTVAEANCENISNGTALIKIDNYSEFNFTITMFQTYLVVTDRIWVCYIYNVNLFKISSNQLKFHLYHFRLASPYCIATKWVYGSGHTIEQILVLLAQCGLSVFFVIYRHKYIFIFLEER